MKTWLDRTPHVLGWIGMLFGLLSFYLQYVFLTHRPTSPEMDVGRIHSVDIKGKIVYLNDIELMLHQWTFPLALLIFCIALILGFMAARKK